MNPDNLATAVFCFGVGMICIAGSLLAGQVWQGAIVALFLAAFMFAFAALNVKWGLEAVE